VFPHGTLDFGVRVDGAEEGGSQGAVVKACLLPCCICRIVCGFW